MSMAIIDEDFLLAKDRATRLRELVLERGTSLSIFAFASVKALSRFTSKARDFHHIEGSALLSER